MNVAKKILLLAATALGFHLSPRRAGQPLRLRAAATLDDVTASLADATPETFAVSLQNLTAVDALRAIDSAHETRPELVETTVPFENVLRVVGEVDAPAQAAAALVGHTMARVKRSAVSPDDRLLSALGPALLRARKNEECVGAMGAISARSAEDLRVGIVAASRLPEGGAQVREFVEEALKTPGTLEEMDENAIKFALKAVARAGDSRTAFSIVDALPEGRRTAPLYHGAITACGKARPMKGRTAMVLWRRMKAEGLDVPRSTYNALLHAAQGAELENATTALLAEMASRNVSLNVVSYNVALNSLAGQGRFGEVLNLLEAMETSGIVPTEVTFGTAINGAAKANNSAAAVALLQAQQKLGVPLGDPAFASALEACVRDPAGQEAAKRAVTVVDAMAEDGVTLARRERIEALARKAVRRGQVDRERLKKDEEILGM
eukprot:CAMPEP_0119273310 /NCGR_PEP_ID=MMETSP1329-20130426/10008_1 /TAXON_ID=114041 /ORGANISM="Genus nov. species nov., Strain RCC1024" /LENGTH=436 /DNA_ID=CAMNT_0007273501 /DNA_START=80 /DNA_END=1387 /DNA_ORIENTATION=+